MRLYRVLAAAAVLAAAVAGCETLPVAGDYPEQMQHGNTLYVAGRYNDALRAFDEAVRQAGDNPELVIAAARRHGDAFCMLQFEMARKDLDAGDLKLALVEIDTALAEPACVKFDEQLKWALTQRTSISARMRKPGPDGVRDDIGATYPK